MQVHGKIKICGRLIWFRVMAKSEKKGGLWVGMHCGQSSRVIWG